MIKRKAALAVVFLTMAVFWSTSASAQDSWWYAGAHYSHTDFDLIGRRASGWSGTIGYEFNPTYGIEATYADLGKVTNRPGTASYAVTTMQLAGTGSFEMTPRIHMFGLLGYFRGDAEVRLGLTTPTPVVQRARDNNYTYAIGVRFYLRQNFLIRGTWQRYRKTGDSLDIGTDVDTLNVGVVARFGNR